MRAAVYRHIDVKPTLLGLSLPGEWAIALAPVLLGMMVDEMGVGAVASIALYATMRIVGFGKPENFFVHWGQWKRRQLMFRGRYSSAARAPLAPRLWVLPYVPNLRIYARLSSALRVLRRAERAKAA
jgi:hypothetical protein